jgi:hypothetical protein
MASDRSEWIRVSCAALCRIEHNGRFLLLLNRNRREKGLYVLTPIGGALAVEDLNALERFSGIIESAESRDLRLVIPQEQLPAFREWFYAGVDRETSPYRELYEELVRETGLLAVLRPDQVLCEHLWTIEEDAFTQRHGYSGWLTHYFLEIYSIKFKSAAVLGPLLIAKPESGAVWVTREQLEHGGMIELTFDGEPRAVEVRGDVLRPLEFDHE